MKRFCMISIKNISIISCLLLFSITGALKQDLQDLEASLNQLLPKIQSTPMSNKTKSIPVFTGSLAFSGNYQLAPSFIDFLNKENKAGLIFKSVEALFQLDEEDLNKHVVLVTVAESPPAEALPPYEKDKWLIDRGYSMIIYVLFTYKQTPASGFVSQVRRDFGFGFPIQWVVWEKGKLSDTAENLRYNKNSVKEITQLINKAL